MKQSSTKGEGMAVRLMFLYIGVLCAGVIFMLFLFFFPFPASADEPKETTVIFGAQCKGPYGYMRKPMTIFEARKALEEYFEKKNLEVRIVDHTDRFVKSEILRSGTHVDTIILDLKTGRMRSILN